MCCGYVKCRRCVFLTSPVLDCVSSYFFFFKQKTAYEMRISDWSSDVCSSDLGFTAVLGVVVVLAMPGLAALAGFEGAKAGALAGQIGRASCRERVCQYV